MICKYAAYDTKMKHVIFFLNEVKRISQIWVFLYVKFS